MRTLRRVARPSPSLVPAVKARTSVGSSTKVTDSAAMTSSTRSPKGERPLSTASPERVEPTMARNWAVTKGSRTTVRRWDGGLVAPSRRVAR